MIDRRTLLRGLGGGVALLPRPALAQLNPARRIPRIGVMTTAGKAEGMLGSDPVNVSLKALLRGLYELGYVFGRDFVIEPRSGESQPTRFREIAADLIKQAPDVIVVPGALLLHFRQAPPTIPIVMAGADSPVAEGYIQSLAHPGGNFTGHSMLSVELTGKRLELLLETAPAAVPVGVIWEATSRAFWEEASSVAKLRGWPLVSLEVADAADLDKMFARAREAQAGALLVHSGGALYGRARQVANRAAAARLPAMYPTRNFVEAGGLMSYAANLTDIWRRSAAFVDKILKGAKPGDLPVEQPTRFELVINSRTAKALGLTVPPAILFRADEVIE